MDKIRNAPMLFENVVKVIYLCPDRVARCLTVNHSCRGNTVFSASKTGGAISPPKRAKV